MARRARQRGGRARVAGCVVAFEAKPAMGDGKKATMETPFDWLTLMVFTGLVVLLLQRSSQEEPGDKLWQYAPPAIGCAVVNWLGNEGYVLPAVLGLVAVIAYIFYVLRPRFTF